MKRIFQHGLMLICLGASALSLHAGDKRDTKAHDAAVAKTRQDAIAKVEGDDLDGAADLVGDHSNTDKGSVHWYQQSAIELVTQAQILRANGDYDGAQRAARAAIKLFAHDLKLKGDAAGPAERANLQIQMAQVYEMLLGDTANARKAYQKALREAPDNVVAQQALARYAADDSKFERIKARKK